MAKVLTVQLQNGKPHIWVLVYTEYLKETHTRVFKSFDTGEPCIAAKPNHRLTYIGTFQDGVFVWHVFEETQY